MLQASVAELKAFKQKMSDREVAVQNAAKKQLSDMNLKVQDLVQRLAVAVGDLDVVKRKADEEMSALKVQLSKVWPGHVSTYMTSLRSSLPFLHCVIPA